MRRLLTDTRRFTVGDWPECARLATFVVNNTPSVRLGNQSPASVFLGRAPLDAADLVGRVHPVQKSRQLVGLEAPQSRPQTDVRRERRLCLHADEPLDRLFRPHVMALEEHLTGKQSAAERAPVEGLGRHRFDLMD